MIEGPNGSSAHAQPHYFMTIQIVTPNGAGIVNGVHNKHPAKLMLEAQRNRQSFIVLFYEEISKELHDEIDAGLKNLNEHSRILTPAR